MGKRMRLDRVLGIGLLLAAAWVIQVTSVAVPLANAAEPVVIRAISAWSLDQGFLLYYKKYIDEVNKRGRGRVEIRLLGGPELVKPLEQFQALRAGIADMTTSASGYFAGETIEGTALDMFDPRDLGKYLKGLRGTEAADLINQAYGEKSAVRFLGINTGGDGFRIFMTSVISGLDDVKGTRIRTSGLQGAKSLQHLGASAVAMTATELYMALQRKVVEGAVRSPIDVFEFGESDLYKSWIATPLQLAMAETFIATRAWNKLSPDVQQLLSSVALELEPQVLEWSSKREAAAIEKLRAKGVRVVEIGPAEQKRLVEARLLYWDEIVAKSPTIGARLRAILEPYSK